jgi:hypothetical protein
MIMGMSDRERQALGSIERRLTGTAPTLTSMLAIFGRLTVGEAMPAREPIRARRRALHGRLSWQPAMLSLWLIVSAGLLAVAFAFNTGSHEACAHFIGMVCRA